MDYKNGKIYSIRSYQTDEIYIGSTCTSLSKRLYKHKDVYKRYNEGKRKHIVSAFEILKYDDCYIELIELYPCNSKIELHKREGELIREMDCVNKFIPGRTMKQYYIDNQDKIKQQRKQYYKDNREKIKQKEKQYRIDNQDKIKQQKKQYRIDNKDKIKQYEKQYRIDNKDKIKQRVKQPINCICGSTIQKTEKARHNRSKKHRTYIFNLHNELNHL